VCVCVCVCVNMASGLFVVLLHFTLVRLVWYPGFREGLLLHWSFWEIRLNQQTILGWLKMSALADYNPSTFQ